MSDFTRITPDTIIVGDTILWEDEHRGLAHEAEVLDIDTEDTLKTVTADGTGTYDVYSYYLLVRINESSALVGSLATLIIYRDEKVWAKK